MTMTKTKAEKTKTKPTLGNAPKVICNRRALFNALTMAGNVVAGRTTNPVLQCVKLTAEDDRLTVAASDREVSIRYSDREVQVEQAGETLVPADKLRDIVRECVDETLVIATGENADGAVTVRGADSQFWVYSGWKVEEFPDIPTFEGEADFEIAGGHLQRLISQTNPFVSLYSTRYNFNGVQIVAKGNKVHFVSTDGRRMAMAMGDLIVNVAGPRTAIVPSKALSLIDKLVDDPEEAVGVQIRKEQILFHTSHATLSSNLISGRFPPYEDVIPKDHKGVATVSTADLLGAVRRAALMTTEDDRHVRFEFAKGGVVVSASYPGDGRSRVSLPLKWDDEPLVIGLDGRYLTEALQAVDTDTVIMEFTAPNRPVLLRGGLRFLYVQMPVNLR